MSKDYHLRTILRQSGSEDISGKFEREFAEVVLSSGGTGALLLDSLEGVALEHFQLGAPFAVVCAHAIQSEFDHMKRIVIFLDLHEQACRASITL